MNNITMLEGMNILVAEDDKLNQKIINFILLKKGATVKTAMNGAEAIELLANDNFDVVLMDLQMPGMGGYATASHIRKNMQNNIPIIALTADTFAHQTDEYLDAGMNACISKPVEALGLCNLIITLTKENKN
ncbi:MAG: hypothetical protein JWQ38_1527 [Flavipsychrobacter sp.]|nr:hypothetical protein [Flavipsychrobacter sp.]